MLTYISFQMGIKQIFANNANLNGLLATPEPLKVSTVIQKCFIKIDENGAEAAAATAISKYCILLILQHFR